MANDPRLGWQPDWAVVPGEILLEALQDRGMTQTELAQRMARPPKTINEIIKGKAAITAETAIQLEQTLGISARFWTNLEATFREAVARREAKEQLEENAGWADGFPLRDLVRHGLIHKGATKAETLGELLSFFRISSPEAFERHWLEAAAFRSSPAFMASPQAVAAWLRWGQIEAAKIPNVPAFDSRRFRKLLEEIRPMTRRGPFMQILNRVKAMCLEVGVIVVLTPEFEGTHLSGATQWVGGRPVIQLSLRHKSDDHFWFTFFHEVGHVLESPRRREFVDAANLESAADHDDDDEAAANRFARDSLLPPDEYQLFVDAGDYSASSIRTFAQAQRIAPGIVVGRLQRDKKVPRSHLNDLKKSIRWATNTR